MKTTISTSILFGLMISSGLSFSACVTPSTCSSTAKTCSAGSIVHCTDSDIITASPDSRSIAYSADGKSTSFYCGVKQSSSDKWQLKDSQHATCVHKAMGGGV